MNFFGHAAVASWHLVAPEAVLGAMLPDFASMARTRLRRVHDATVARGVTLHHDTDSVFHAAPSFVALCNDAGRELEDLGLGRGSARAVAHVGTELVLDGWLTERDQGHAEYLAALRVDPDRVVGAVELWHPEGPDRMRGLLERLRGYGVPHGYREPAFVGERLAQALAHRPRLRLGDEDRRRVTRWLDGWQRRVRAEAPALMAQVRQGLASPPADG
ncbi:MAG: hypothetical protein ACOC9O_00270 [Myxococcota bacterium]